MAPARRKTSAPAAVDPPAPPFEQAMERLEQIVERLESGDLSLDASLEAFEEGVALARGSAAQLDAADRRIETLIREGDEWLVRSFEGVEDDEDEA